MSRLMHLIRGPGRWLWTASLAWSLTACGGDEGGALAPGDGSRPSPYHLHSPPQLCEVFYGALSALAETCDYGAASLAHDYYVATLPGHSCASTSRIDDVDSLVRVCLPSLTSGSCEPFEQGLDSACLGQVVYQLDLVRPSQACDDLINAWGVSNALCGERYDLAVSSLRASLDVPCQSVVRLRDAESLYSACLSAILNAPCDDLDSAFEEATCQGQLIY